MSVFADVQAHHGAGVVVVFVAVEVEIVGDSVEDVVVVTEVASVEAEVSSHETHLMMVSLNKLPSWNIDLQPLFAVSLRLQQSLLPSAERILC